MGHSKGSLDDVERDFFRGNRRLELERDARGERALELDADGDKSGAVRAVGDEGGDRPASDKALEGSLKNCSWSFSPFHPKCRRRIAAVDSYRLNELKIDPTKSQYSHQPLEQTGRWPLLFAAFP